MSTRSAFSAVLVLSLRASLLLQGLAGCTTSPGNPGDSAGPRPPTVPTVTPAGDMPRDCGTVSMLRARPPTGAEALQAENCFWAAYVVCQSAVLTVEDHGLDIVSTTTFTIQAGSACQVAGTTDTFVLPRTHHTSSFACARLMQDNGGLLFVACGDAGDILVPPPPSPRPG